MKDNKKGPALYELITSQSNAKRQMQQQDLQEGHENLDHNVLTPGRSVRMSVGTAGICIAVCIALIVVAFTMGFRKGHAIAIEDYGNRLFEEFQSSTLADPDYGSGNGSESETPLASGLTQQPTTTQKNNPWGLITSDPRVAGQHYYVLMHTTKEGAMQLGTFCRERGLETYVVSGHNTRSYQVIAMPGFKERRGIWAEELKTQIASIGKQWAKTKASAGSDLQDAYPTLYN